MLHLLQQQQQQHQAQAQDLVAEADRVSVGCQTRQGDHWRVQSQGCAGTPKQDAGHWAHHGSPLAQKHPLHEGALCLSTRLLLNPKP